MTADDSRFSPSLENSTRLERSDDRLESNQQTAAVCPSSETNDDGSSLRERN